MWSVKIYTQSLRDSIFTYAEAKISRSALTSMLEVGVESVDYLNGFTCGDNRAEVIKTKINSVAMFIIDNFDTCMSIIIYFVYRY